MVNNRNNHLSYTLAPEINQIFLLEENNYYPFGLKHGGYNTTKKEIKYNAQLAGSLEIQEVLPEAMKFKYKYNGKELQDELGLNVYDYGARTYDPAVPRFWQVDPLAEKYSFQSVYVYADDNPVLFVDINGMGTEDDYKLDKKTGNIKLIKKTDDNFDRLYATDDNGNVDNNVDPLVIYKQDENGDGTVNGDDGSLISRLSTKYQTISLFDNGSNDDDSTSEIPTNIASESNKSIAWKTFKFLADHSDVEWSINKFKLNANNFVGYQVGTYHMNDNLLYGMSWQFSPGLIWNPTYAMSLGTMHSHPNESEIMSSMNGDISYGKNYHRINGINKPYQIYFPNNRIVHSIKSYYGNVVGNDGKKLLHSYRTTSPKHFKTF